MHQAILWCILQYALVSYNAPFDQYVKGGRGISAIDLINYIIYIDIGLGEQGVSLAYYLPSYLPMCYIIASAYIGLWMS